MAVPCILLPVPAFMGEDSSSFLRPLGEKIKMRGTISHPLSAISSSVRVLNIAFFPSVPSGQASDSVSDQRGGGVEKPPTVIASPPHFMAGVAIPE